MNSTQISKGHPRLHLLQSISPKATSSPQHILKYKIKSKREGTPLHSYIHPHPNRTEKAKPTNNPPETAPDITLVAADLVELVEAEECSVAVMEAEGGGERG